VNPVRQTVEVVKCLMSLAELLPAVRSLPHQDKLRLLQFLARELLRDEGLPDIRAGADYPVWSPYEAFAAARVLGEALQAEGG
jgi:hypothetical protein